MRWCYGVALASLLLVSCAGVLESNEPAPQSYVLRSGARPDAAAKPGAGPMQVLQIERVQAGPGLDTDYIVLVRADRRFDYFAGSRWADSTPQLIEALLVDTLRDSGRFRAVFGNTAAFPPDYSLSATVRRFEADYAAGEETPTVHVVFDVSLGRRKDGALLAAFSAAARTTARENRMTAVVAAFEAATQTALADVSQRVLATLQNVDSPEASISR